MIMLVLGSIGQGLVWGWLIGNLGGREQAHLQRVALVRGGATLLWAAEVFLFANLAGMIIFLGATILSSLLYRGLRTILFIRVGSQHS